MSGKIAPLFGVTKIPAKRKYPDHAGGARLLFPVFFWPRNAFDLVAEDRKAGLWAFLVGVAFEKLATGKPHGVNIRITYGWAPTALTRVVAPPLQPHEDAPAHA